MACNLLTWQKYHQRQQKIEKYRIDVFEFLARHNREHDIIFADPPYELTNLNEIIASVFDKKLLSQEGVLILEHSKI